MSANTFEINTAQNVTLNYEIAGIGERIVASILDDLIKLGYTLLVIFITGVSSIYSKAFGILFVFLIPAIFYTLFFEIYMQGQTPGKRMRKIKVVKLDGSQASVGDYLIRWLFRLIDVNILYGVIGIVTMAINKRGQRLGDILAKTTVIRVHNRISLKDTLYEKLNSDYKPVYQEARKLSSEDVELIKKVLNTREYRENFEMVYNLTNKIQSKMNVSRTEGPEDFLETVVKDYNYLCDE